MKSNKLLAGLVHFYTGLSGILAFFTLTAVVRGDYPRAFLWLLVTFVVDGTDGTLARRFRIREVLPELDGGTLDLVVDFLTYALAPLFLIWAAGLLPSPPWLWATLILVASLLDFAKVHPYKDEGVFTGLPAMWNLYAFYVFYYRPAPWVQAAAILALVAVTVLPVPFIHISRFPRFRTAHRLLLAAWLTLYGVVTQGWSTQPRLWLALSWIYPVFYFGASALFARFPRGGTPAAPAADEMLAG